MIAGQRLWRGACAVDGGQRFHLCTDGQLIAQRRAHRVAAAVGGLEDGVVSVVDIIRIVAGEACHDVLAAAAVEHIGAGVTDKHVGDAVAGEVDGGRALVVGGPQHLHPHVGGERIVHGDLRGVGAFQALFQDEIVGVIDNKRVVAEFTDHGVDAGASVDGVVAAFTVECIVVRVAGQRVVVVAAEQDVLAIAADEDVVAVMPCSTLTPSVPST